ncbi:carboxylesterase [Thelonectria olida]|uniref:Carboxylic ester hydrolase n=1 Tax=Thelonectria olida TaxID=1576542 RepID=A0A9P8VRH2_9HYPO|nr:carboxylesterase [Thelonectria olida]
MPSLTIHSYTSLVLVALITASSARSHVDRAVSSRERWTVGQIVQTSSGPVQGHAASNAGEVSEYLGIPYAKPPIGELRFQPPIPFNGTQIVNGASFGFSCMGTRLLATESIDPDSVQTLGMTDVAINLLQELEPSKHISEDCLTLNVWTKPQAGESKKAVLVWIHGGGFISGGSAVPWYNGQFIADQEDVVIVTINYRLTIFGFPGNPTSPPNLGLLDQRMAVEWIRRNINGFGGDPDRITLFGQSAGGISVDYYSYAWTTDPIAHGFISQSGTATSLVQSTKAEASTNWFNASAALGCGNSSSDHNQVFECMQRKPAADMLSVLPSIDFRKLSNIAYSPTVDDALVFSTYRERKAADLPILVGNTDFEAGLLRLFAPGVREDLWHVFNQRTYVCPAGERASYGMLTGTPTWRYRYFGEFPNLRLTTNPPSGAWHAAEIPILFDTIPTTAIANTPEQVAIGKYMRGAWAAFAKDPANGLTTYEDGWPQYSPSDRTLVRIGFDNMTGTNLAVGTQYDGGCPLSEAAPNQTTGRTKALPTATV